ncbi:MULTISPECIES: PfkB family carbohydrate kinase [unclassified Saccharicrinis]|uniref:PfkB family carbohydrate kinase n=1 Tax=unclassified Saccharicrinis TaxID=2646859 RepID=UPI003D33B8A2
MGKVIVFGEVMLRLSTEEHLRFHQADKLQVTYGGGEANVAISLSNFNVNTGIVSRFPANDIGNACIKSLKKFGVDTSQVLSGGKRLGIYFLETGADQRGSKVVYDRDNSSFATLKPGMIDWDTVLEDATWFHWSGLSAAIAEEPTKALEEGVRAAHKKGITISCDINLRSNLWNYGKTPNQVMPPLVAMCDVIFGNEYDAEQAMGIEVGESIRGKFTKESFISSSKMVMEKYPKIKNIVTTRRGNVSASHNKLQGLMFNGKELIETPIYEITHIVDRVGGGDAFTAGVIYGMLNWLTDHQRTLNFALAASSLKHTILGDANLVTVDEVERNMKSL